MGVRFSHQRKSSTPLIISVTPRGPSEDPPREAMATREAVVTREPLKSNLVPAGSRSSLLLSCSSSSSSSSPVFLKEGNRRVSFDLLAEMAYAFPEQPLSPILVELGDNVVVGEDVSHREGGEVVKEGEGGVGGGCGVGKETSTGSVGKESSVGGDIDMKEEQGGRKKETSQAADRPRVLNVTT